MKKPLVLMLITTFLLSLTSLSALASSNNEFIEFSEKHDVVLDKKWTIKFSGTVTKDKIDRVSIESANNLVTSSFETTGDKQITVSSKTNYEPNSRYSLEIFLTNGNKYRMYFNTLASKPIENLTVELEVLRLVNVERSMEGLEPLIFSNKLTEVAKIKSQDMADSKYFSHLSPTYGSPFDMMEQFGINYRTAGENIAKGHPSAKVVMEAWMNSPGHKKNILHTKFGKLGVGYVVKDGTPYWTQMFTD